MARRNQTQKYPQSDQLGMVSILVVTFIMIVLGLITMAFTQLVNREQRQVLDRQLNAQAFYAAESGVNDVINYIRNTGTPPLKEECAPSAEFSNYELDTVNGIGYSCLLVDPTVPEIVINPLHEKDTKVLTLKHADGSGFNSVQFFWEDIDGGSGVNCPNNFPIVWPSDACDAGVLRVDLVPFSSSKTRSQLADSTATVFFRPSNNGSATGVESFGNVSGGSQGAVVEARCANGQRPRLCQGTISGLSGSETTYYARIKPIYRPAAITICSPNCDNRQEFSEAQAIVDVTGKASDVLRRIQVRIPLSGLSSETLQFSLQTGGSICKRLEVAPPDFVDLNGC